MTRPFRRILAGAIATASPIATVPAAQATLAQPDPNEPIICVRCGALSRSRSRAGSSTRR